MDESIEDRSARTRIEAAARGMTAQRRAIFLAVALEDASYEEIGTRVGLTPADVEREFVQALLTLADAADG